MSNPQSNDNNDIHPPRRERKNGEVNNTPEGNDLTYTNIAKTSFRTFVNSFVLAYGIRTGISLVLRIIQIGRQKKPQKWFSIRQLVSEEKLHVREDAVRLGLTLASFTGGFTFLNSILRKFRGVEDGINNLVAGTIAGLSLLFQKKENRRTISLYLLVRLLQASYNALKARGWWHFWGSHWNHGDSLLFMVTSAQVMYAYVMRPDSIPESYQKFIVRSGPIKEVVLEAVRNNNRGLPINTTRVNDYIQQASKGLSKLILGEFPPIIPCGALHPHNASCSKNAIDVFISTGRKILPLYATLTLVPLVVIRSKSLIKAPLSNLFKAFLSTAQSAAFFASFVSLYQTFVCGYRKIFQVDHKIEYFLAGLFCSLSIFIEKKSRRSELALYVLPRALDSWYTMLYDRRWLGGVPFGELILFMISTGGLMYFYHNEPQTMSPALQYICKIIFRRHVI